MANSSLEGFDRPNPRQPGHDVDALGPSDTSDSGSDMTGVGELDAADTQLPLDIALQEDRQRSATPLESLVPGADSDSSGSGERASAAGDGSSREAADITPDRIDDLGGSFGGSLGDSDDDELLDIASAPAETGEEGDGEAGIEDEKRLG